MWGNGSPGRSTSGSAGPSAHCLWKAAVSVRPAPSARVLSLCCTPPLHVSDGSIRMERGRQQNDSLADGHAIAVGETVTLLHPLSTCIRCFNTDRS